MDIKSLCRLCADSVEFGHNIFTEYPELNISEIILKYLSINVTVDDCLPKIICDECKNKILIFDEYALKCSNLQLELTELVQKSILANVNSSDTESKVVDDVILMKDEIKEELELKQEDSDYCYDDDNISNASDDISNDDTTKYKSKNFDDDYFPPIKKVPLTQRKDKKPKRPKNTNVKKREKIDYSILKFDCHLCKETFPSWGRLNFHTHFIHTTQPKIVCVCKKVISSRNSIKRHLLRHAVNEDVGRQKKSCSNCQTEFKQQVLLEKHMRVCLTEDKYPFPCSECTKRCISADSLKYHQRKHLPPELKKIYPCEFCENKFVSISCVKKHVELMHLNNNSRPFVCDICGSTFKLSGALVKHQEIHTEEKNFECPQCSKRFKSKRALNRHMDTHGGTSYKCPKCPAILNTKQTLSAHQVIHENFHRYACGFCDKTFKRKKVLMCHVNRHTGHNPYICPWCPKTFVDNSHLRNHKKRMHPAELSQYEAIHGSPLDKLNKNDGSQNTKIINCNIISKLKTKPVIVPKILPEAVKKNNSTLELLVN